MALEYTGRNCHEKMYRVYATEKTITVKDVNRADRKERTSPGVTFMKGDKNGVLISYADLMNSDQLRKELTGLGPDHKQNLRLERVEDYELAAVEQNNIVPRTYKRENIVDTALLESQNTDITFFKNKEEMLCTLYGKKPLRQYGTNGKEMFDENGDRLEANIPCFFDRQMIIVEDGKSMGFTNPYDENMITPVLGFFVANREEIQIGDKMVTVSKEDNSGIVIFCHCFAHGHTEDLIFRGRNFRYISGELSIGEINKKQDIDTTSIDIPVEISDLVNISTNLTSVEVKVNGNIVTVPVTFDSNSSMIKIDVSGIGLTYNDEISIIILENAISGVNDEGNTITNPEKTLTTKIESKPVLMVPKPILSDPIISPDQLTYEFTLSNVEGPEFTTTFDNTKFSSDKCNIDSAAYTANDKKLVVVIKDLTHGVVNMFKVLVDAFINTADPAGKYTGTASNDEKVISFNLAALPVTPKPAFGNEVVATDFTEINIPVSNFDGVGTNGYTSTEIQSIQPTGLNVTIDAYTITSTNMNIKISGLVRGTQATITIPGGILSNVGDGIIYDGTVVSDAKVIKFTQPTLPKVPTPSYGSHTVDAGRTKFSIPVVNVEDAGYTTVFDDSKITTNGCIVSNITYTAGNKLLTMDLSGVQHGATAEIILGADAFTNTADATQVYEGIAKSALKTIDVSLAALADAPTPIIGTENVVITGSTAKVTVPVTNINGANYTTTEYVVNKVSAVSGCTIANVAFAGSNITFDVTSFTRGIANTVEIAASAFENTGDGVNLSSNVKASASKIVSFTPPTLTATPAPVVGNATPSYSGTAATLVVPITDVEASGYTTSYINGKVINATNCTVTGATYNSTAKELTISLSAFTREVANTVTVDMGAFVNVGDEVNYTGASSSVSKTISFTPPALSNAPTPVVTGSYSSTDKKVTLACAPVDGSGYTTSTDASKITLASGNVITVNYVSPNFEFDVSGLSAGDYTVNIASGAVYNTGDGTTFKVADINNVAGTFDFTIAAPSAKVALTDTAFFTAGEMYAQDNSYKSNNDSDMNAAIITDTMLETKLSNIGVDSDTITFPVNQARKGKQVSFCLVPTSLGKTVIWRDAGGVDITKTTGTVTHQTRTLNGISYEFYVLKSLTSVSLTLEIK